ncbi:MAG: SUMF1/EgtB/PvdO family nonheme iron enzyme, partial [Spirochaetota bacterium]
ISDLIGNLWEWCDTWYYPFDYCFSSVKEKDVSNFTLHNGAEKSVRGGSWANLPETIKPWTRGSQPPSWCTPFLGFRPVIAQKH